MQTERKIQLTEDPTERGCCYREWIARLDRVRA